MVPAEELTARHRHWLVGHPICLWTDGVQVAISTCRTLPGKNVITPAPPTWTAVLDARGRQGQELDADGARQHVIMAIGFCQGCHN